MKDLCALKKRVYCGIDPVPAAAILAAPPGMWPRRSELMVYWSF
jgi:hypothetical protein